MKYKEFASDDYVVVDLRADPCKPSVHFGRQYSRYHNPSWIKKTGHGWAGSEQHSVYPFLSFIGPPPLEYNGGLVNKPYHGDSLMVC